MQRVFIYQLGVSGSSLMWVIISVLSLALSLIINGMSQSVGSSAGTPNPSAALEGLLLLTWLLQGFTVPCVASQASSFTRESGLLEWWIASGVPPWRVVLAQSLAILFCWLLYLLAIVFPISLWLLKEQGGIPWRLLMEFDLLQLASGGLLLLLTFSLGAFLSRIISCIGAGTIWLIALCGGGIACDLINCLPESFRMVAGWVWGALPRFDLYYRPTALVYRWPPLDLSILASLLGYGLGYAVLLLLCCEGLYRPRYGR